MKLTVDAKINLRDKEVREQVHQATRDGLRDVVVLMHGDAVQNSPYLTGNNRRSLASEVSGMGLVAGTFMERVCDARLDEAALYSTSGYGGWLEVGTGRMAARPYIKPAFDRHKGKLSEKIKGHLSGR